MILSYGKRAVISLLALWLAGCSAPPQTIRTPPDAVYHLDQGDEINIAVSGEQDLTMRVKIDNSGSVDYPYIGSLMLKGKRLNRSATKLPISCAVTICRRQW